jgi:hypothetical protein
VLTERILGALTIIAVSGSQSRLPQLMTHTLASRDFGRAVKTAKWEGVGKGA